jgi:hypothetical protein
LALGNLSRFHFTFSLSKLGACFIGLLECLCAVAISGGSQIYFLCEQFARRNCGGFTLVLLAR